MSTNDIRSGDFSYLADNYSENRPDYAPVVLSSLLELFDKPSVDIRFADVGAGTGIWTRMVYQRGVKSAIAVEPNRKMRANGITDSIGTSILCCGAAENTGLDTASQDWVTMASSFHWAQFDSAISEFHRILRRGGWFTALWNPRLIERSPLLLEIDDYLHKLAPELQRVSSGRSGITHTLKEKINKSDYFKNVVYHEGEHTIKMSPERYVGIWRSVNDIPNQIGVDKFKIFLNFIENRLSDVELIDATYLTRAWSAIRRD